MTEIETIDLKSMIVDVVSDVFNTMLSLDLEYAEAGNDLDETNPADHSEKVVGSVGLAGEVMGAISIHVALEFACLITATMLGMDVSEVEGGEEVNDVIGELSNMIGGSLKSHFCDLDLPCVLSIPSITRGKNFQIETMSWARQEKFAFRHQQHVAMVEVYLKTVN